ncbi:hypothetical protein ACLK2I_13800 [Escherichia coli]
MVEFVEFVTQEPVVARCHVEGGRASACSVANAGWGVEVGCRDDDSGRVDA